MTERDWIVQKFGGTSVGKFPIKIAKEIIDVYEKENRVVVVCSARSNNIKSQGTTTCLIRAAEYSVDRKDFKGVIEGIQDDHLNASRAAISSDHLEIREELERQVISECANVTRILEATNILDEVSDRTMDLVLSVGERLACLFMVSVLKSIGKKAELVDLTRVVSTSTLDINSSSQDFYDHLRTRISSQVEEVARDGAIPVVTGFFGLVPGGLINAVGRGYTDLCAALCAVGLGAKELQIWKEVDGIFTADPRKVPEARLLPQISPEEAAELTYYGSEVIHPFTMDQVIRAHIPIRIKNVMNPPGEGTKVFPVELTDAAEIQLLNRGPTAITSKSNIIVLNIVSNRTRQSHGFLAQVFGILDKWRLVVDLISTSEVHVSMAIHEAAPDAALVEALKAIRKFSSVEVTDGLSIVSLVGTEMRHNIGIAAKMFSTLSEIGVNIEMISQGSSEINISCVIHASEVSKALKSLHLQLLSR